MERWKSFIKIQKPWVSIILLQWRSSVDFLSSVQIIRWISIKYPVICRIFTKKYRRWMRVHWQHGLCRCRKRSVKSWNVQETVLPDGSLWKHRTLWKKGIWRRIYHWTRYVRFSVYRILIFLLYLKKKRGNRLSLIWQITEWILRQRWYWIQMRKVIQ